MNILSLFDGMSCGMLAFQNAEVQVDKYYAYEIDKYAVQTSLHNFPDIIQCGDVFEADFTKYKDIDFVVGGSPCTYWSIAQTAHRETTASGLGWELFSQYVRAIKEVKPKFFIYENNKSMSAEIRQSITETFGFDAVCINSALVSAQNRQRLYWVGKRNTDGTYSQVYIDQPVDRHILLKDILDSGIDLTTNDKSFTLTASYDGACAWNTIERFQRNMVAEPVNCTADGKSQTLKAQYVKSSVDNFCKYTSTYGATGVAEPVQVTAIAQRGRPVSDDATNQFFEARSDNKSNCITTVDKNAMVAISVPANKPVRVLTMGNSQGDRLYDINAKSVCQTAEGGGLGGNTGLYAIPVYEFMDYKIRDNAHITINENAIRNVQDKNNASCAEGFYEFTDRKANTLTTAHVPKIIDDIENYIGYAQPCEWDENGNPTKAISGVDGKTYTVYTVKNGEITIKEKQYSIKLSDGYYIIRKLTVSECKRLQTVPEWYEFPVSQSQAYKMLGNGWTVEVITHLINRCLNPIKPPVTKIKLF